MTIASAHLKCMSMSKLFRYDNHRRTGLHELAGIGVAQTVKGEFAWQSGAQDRQLEQFHIENAPGFAICANEQQISWRTVLNQLQEKGHSLVWKEHEAMSRRLMRQHVDAVAVLANVTHLHFQKFARAASGIQRRHHKWT